MNLENLPQVPQDKANHHIYGALKEAWDRLTGKGDPSFADFVATATGALPIIAGIELAGAA